MPGLLDEARQRALQLQTAADISRDVSGSLIVDELLEKSVNLIRDQFNYYHAAIFLVDKTGDYASIREASGDIGAKDESHRTQAEGGIELDRRSRHLKGRSADRQRHKPIPHPSPQSPCCPRPGLRPASRSKYLTELSGCWISRAGIPSPFPMRR